MNFDYILILEPNPTREATFPNTNLLLAKYSFFYSYSYYSYLLLFWSTTIQNEIIASLSDSSFPNIG